MAHVITNTPPNTASTNLAPHQKLGAHSSRRSSTQPPEQTQKIIGNYLFERTIGEGSFAKVKLAVHRLTNKKVCIERGVFGLNYC